MSVRNQYARNYTKVAPFPPSNKLIADAKIAARRAASSIAAQDKRARTDHPDKSRRCFDVGTTSSDVVPTSSQRRVLPGHENVSADSTRNVAVIDKHALDAMTMRAVHASSDNHGDENTGQGRSATNSAESVRTTNDSEVLTVWHDEQNNNTQDVISDNKNFCDQKTQDNEDTDSKPLRPKSARPESRWERRMVNTVFDNSNERAQSKPIRPKSARPESRMMRMMEANAQGELSSYADLPPRPKTSYGQRRGSGAGSEFSAGRTERPKSRIGYHEVRDEGMFDNDEQDAQPKKRDKKSKRHHHMERERETTRHGGDVSASGSQHGLGNGSPHEQFTRWRSKTVLDLNSGIDDIDLDVDPVLYFMQDDEGSSEPAVTKQALSQDTISFIGNASSLHQRQGKSAYGYHDNYLDKHSVTGKQNIRFHGNRVNSVQNSLADSERFSLNNAARRGSKSRNDPFVMDNARSSQLVEMTLTDSFPDAYNYVSRQREIINECRGQQAPSDGAMNDRLHPGISTCDNRGGIPYRRHPRKLQPISAIYSNNT